ncbi:PREDICTED: basic blue protein-like [Nelumbo nucifera]|uniref:Plantacyanin n=2 Tax=Nelumbo nucifera TaxID=4432 RepID=A0A1U7YQE7_NELNU|nr:PREDICTED: basic blue protein-like [Nelumbo nucifera]DAD23903.1 TPA_asm: hypothetical protein HUJ06_025366 [Nelumbo nucifera]
MAAQGRGSATQAATTAASLLLLCLLVQLDTTSATSYVVGDDAGWTYNVQNWPDGKTFKAGDTLVFSYDPMLHNVVEVDNNGYYSCMPAVGSTIYTSGNDQITLSEGPHYFICGFPGHCEAAMRIAVNAF